MLDRIMKWYRNRYGPVVVKLYDGYAVRKREFGGFVYLCKSRPDYWWSRAFAKKYAVVSSYTKAVALMEANQAKLADDKDLGTPVE